MHKKLMVVGPTEIEPDILLAGAIPQDYMRTASFSARLAKIQQNLQYVFQTRHPVVIFSSSGTGAMDAAVNNFLSSGEHVIVINGGTFGQRWVDICRHYRVTVSEIKLTPGKSVKLDEIEHAIINNPTATTLYATLNETSFGTLTDIQRIGNLLENYPHLLFIVDCVSGLLAERLEMDAWHIDVALSASQKAFAIPPGLAFMAVNDKALIRAEKANLRGYYFDLLTYLKDWRRNQTPFTPAISLLFQLEKRLEKIINEGLPNLQKRYADLTRQLRDGLQKLGFPVFAECPANCVTAVITDPYHASDIVRILSHKHHIEITPSAGEWQTRLIRIGNFGHITSADIEHFLLALQHTLAELSK